MGKRFRLDKENSDDIGFVYTCLISGVVSLLECKDWIYHVIEIENDVPNYMFDILDIEHKSDFIPLRIIGFTPSWNKTDAEDYALEGIGYKRQGDFVSDAVSRAKAIKSLKDNPHIEERFREMFPFIEW